MSLLCWLHDVRVKSHLTVLCNSVTPKTGYLATVCSLLTEKGESHLFWSLLGAPESLLPCSQQDCETLCKVLEEFVTLTDITEF